MNRVGVIILVLLLAFAGCTGFVGDGDTETSEKSVTPPTPEGDSGPPTQPPSDGYPSGVSEAGLENATELVRAHDDALREGGYQSTLDMTIDAVDDGERLATIGSETTVSADGQSYLHVTRESGYFTTDFEEVTWANESVQVTNYTQLPAYGMANTRLEMQEPVTPADGPANDLVGLVHPGEFDVVEVADDRLILRATSFDQESVEVTITHFDGQIVVDRQGRIHEADVEVRIMLGEDEVSYNIVYGLDVGAVEIEKPTWIDAAIEEVTAITIEATVEGDSVAVTNTGHEAIPSGATISFLEQRGEDSWTGSFTDVDRAIEPGETFYLSLDNREVVLSQSPPANTDPLSGIYRIAVRVGGPEPVAETIVDADGE